MNLIEMELPWPPSMNEYWHMRVVTPREGKPFVQVYIAAAGVEFRRRVNLMLLGRRKPPLTGRLTVSLCIMAPRRGSDIDNRVKPVLDALENAAIFENDEQVDRLRVIRGPRCKGGKVIARIWEREGRITLWD